MERVHHLQQESFGEDPLRTAEVQVIYGSRPKPPSQPQLESVSTSPPPGLRSASSNVKTLISDQLERGEWLEGFHLGEEVREALSAPLCFTSLHPESRTDPVLAQLAEHSATEHSSYISAALKRRATLLYRSRRSSLYRGKWEFS